MTSRLPKLSKLSRSIARVVGLCFCLCAGLGATVAGVLVHPQPLYSYEVSAGRLSLHSDRPFDPARGRAVLEDVEARLRGSSLDRHHGEDRIFISNARWRERLTFLWSFGAGGLNYYPLTRNVFLRAANIERGLLLSPDGPLVAPPRTLAYFAAHEIAHSLTGERVGPLAYHRLPVWLREGVADYMAFVGTGADDLDSMARLYLEGEDPAFDHARSGLYTRYRFLVAYLVERMGWSLEELIDSPIEQAEAEALVRESVTAHRGVEGGEWRMGRGE